MTRGPPHSAQTHWRSLTSWTRGRSAGQEAGRPALVLGRGELLSGTQRPGGEGIRHKAAPSRRAGASQEMLFRVVSASSSLSLFELQALLLAWLPEPKTPISGHTSSEQVLRGGATDAFHSKSGSPRQTRTQKNPRSRWCQSPGCSPATIQPSSLAF